MVRAQQIPQTARGVTDCTGKAILRMAELAAHALRTLAFDDVANQDAACAAGALPLLIQQLNPAATAGLQCAS